LTGEKGDRDLTGFSVAQNSNDVLDQIERRRHGDTKAGPASPSPDA
jgi:hypothetical protein